MTEQDFMLYILIAAGIFIASCIIEITMYSRVRRKLLRVENKVNLLIDGLSEQRLKMDILQNKINEDLRLPYRSRPYSPIYTVNPLQSYDVYHHPSFIEMQEQKGRK